MFDHIGFNVGNLEKSLAFYKAVLAPLGLGVLESGEGWAMLGGYSGRLWIGAFGPPPGPIHMAFRAGSRGMVHAFYEAGLASGGRDNGAPGIRTQYAPDYFAAFLLDPDGHNVEAVTFVAEN
ncbi:MULTISPECIES: VOC family protein [unclassified Mesorhizobium]|jgi:catechol 2,3-dioxygenase-like lactoylglutathione lyase family enzyme|uniref:VOC family protein n=1 Tax=unclassified Mesorhizobium TaxID=325217 RepID=UPI000FD87AE5|nr:MULTISPECIES: VOC family protein [unclassified Mesorhizobium]RWL50238.1 MAG: VOC family protein [Mesorhizobium sp.]TGQ16221.1 VOC family protein [Mesorhizobium sp. M2E.F.Ca.ET.219.01.1.1]TGS19170.1 VOC family protein [Mesorhizobium sp. M2E.F.Ca.ET.209.01.1.1]TGT77682.1 VOC family protein [Mesorhizobium sp. M2E.F.Ca.ET.166.01.1.1]TGW03791.1 VOC family protein [Mesorhizobium sp. M2E.F.Ca.ET.154.01.1.1]